EEIIFNFEASLGALKSRLSSKEPGQLLSSLKLCPICIACWFLNSRAGNKFYSKRFIFKLKRKEI
ncbi:hypothetical protein, partial [Autumnicola edwardsiae]